MTAKRIALLIAPAVLVTSCGGGGGGGALTSSPATITEDNAPVIAGEVMQVTVATAGVAGNTDPTPASAAATAPQALALTNASSSALTRAAQMTPTAGAVPQTVGPETLDCDISGTVTVSGDIENDETLTPGDRITANFNNCDDGDGVLDGLLDLHVQSFEGDPFGVGGFSGRLAATFTELRFIEGADNYVANGAVTLDLAFNDVTGDETITVFGPELDLEAGSERWRLSDFTTTLVTDPVLLAPDPATDRITVTSAGTLFSSQFEGTVDFTTVQPFIQTGTDGTPTGEMLISGADGATITVITDGDPDNVLLEIDLDGDDVSDNTITTTWDALVGTS